MAGKANITEVHYRMAKAKGVPEDILIKRVRSLGWTPARAANTPFAKYADWKNICDQNKVNEDSFRHRLSNGWTPEEAATILLRSKRIKQGVLK